MGAGRFDRLQDANFSTVPAQRVPSSSSELFAMQMEAETNNYLSTSPWKAHNHAVKVLDADRLWGEAFKTSAPFPPTDTEANFAKLARQTGQPSLYEDYIHYRDQFSLGSANRANEARMYTTSDWPTLVSLSAGFVASLKDPLALVGMALNPQSIPSAIAMGVASEVPIQAIVGNYQKEIGGDYGIEDVMASLAGAGILNGLGTAAQMGLDALLKRMNNAPDARAYKAYQNAVNQRVRQGSATPNGPAPTHAPAQPPPAPAPAPTPPPPPPQPGGPAPAPPRQPTVVQPTGDPMGRLNTMTTPVGNISVEYQWEVLELDDILTSADKGYDPVFQPRDRTKQESDAQIAHIANNLDPNLLLAHPNTDRGAPVIGMEDNMVESGNGRAEALRNTPSWLYDDYRAAIEQFIGAPVTQKRPVLVRRRITPMTRAERIRFTEMAGADSSAALPREKKTLNIPDNVIRLYRGGQLDTKDNAPFIQSFLRHVPVGELPAFSTGGVLSDEGVRTIHAWLMKQAYDGVEGSNELLTKLQQSKTPAMQGLMTMLRNIAGNLAVLRKQLKGTPSEHLDITTDLIRALREVENLRAGGKDLEAYLSVPDMLGRSSETEALMRLLYTSRPPVVERVLNLYIERAAKEAAQPSFVDPVDLGVLIRGSESDIKTGAARPGSAEGEGYDLIEGLDGNGTPEAGPAATAGTEPAAPAVGKTEVVEPAAPAPTPPKVEDVLGGSVKVEPRHSQSFLDKRAVWEKEMVSQAKMKKLFTKEKDTPFVETNRQEYPNDELSVTKEDPLSGRQITQYTYRKLNKVVYSGQLQFVDEVTDPAAIKALYEALRNRPKPAAGGKTLHAGRGEGESLEEWGRRIFAEKTDPTVDDTLKVQALYTAMKNGDSVVDILQTNVDRAADWAPPPGEFSFSATAEKVRGLDDTPPSPGTGEEKFPAGDDAPDVKKAEEDLSALTTCAPK